MWYSIAVIVVLIILALHVAGWVLDATEGPEE